jgi:poly(hydroxyalkanoate) depolymerase family esterase
MSVRWIVDMKEAARLTRGGRLREATALLRSALAGSAQHGAKTDEGPRYAQAPGIAGTFEFPELPGLHTGLQIDLPGKAKVHVDVPPGATFAEHRFQGAGGARPYKLYVPTNYVGQPMPLVVMLHGCTQSPDDFAAGTRMNDVAEEQGFLVAYPEQIKAANAHKCWNWFNAADQMRGRGEPAVIEGIVRQIMSRYAVDQRRVYVAGLSAGGASAAVMASAYPDLFAAVGIHSGLACGAARDLPSALVAMQKGAATPAQRIVIPAIVFHGDRDKTVNPANADAIAGQAGSSGDARISVSSGRSPGGMGYTRSVQHDERGKVALERWTLHGAGHAWSGGSSDGSYTEPRGPDASREMARFFRDVG